MVHYDSKLIYDFAGKLYHRASSIVVSYTLIGAVVGAAIGAALEVYTRSQVGWWTAAAAGMVGLLAFLVGQERAFWLRLQAQLALCQVKVEENTRK